MIEATDRLNAPTRAERLSELRRLLETTELESIPFGEEVNNHVHTMYSFSPYSPSATAFHARRAGLRVVGSVDHESIAAAEEMKTAAEIVGIGSTVGTEVRVDFSGTPFEDKKLNNPDTIGNAYIVIHGVPRGAIPAMSERMKPLNTAREERNRIEVVRLNEIIAGELGALDYDRDVRPLSWAEAGGSVTERHILYALSLRVIDAVTDPSRTGEFLRERLDIDVEGIAQERIEDPQNPHRAYDLLGVFKSEFVPQFFVQPGADECPPVREITMFARELGAIPAYSYLGDVKESPTGDKKAQQFEDAYIDELFAALPDLGFQAVTYMPPRNTFDQLTRIQKLAARYGMMEISGVDINSSRQSFHCPEVLRPEFRHLGESTWALVGHEIATAEDSGRGLFGGTEGGGAAGRRGSVVPGDLSRRIATFAALGKEHTPSGRLDT